MPANNEDTCLRKRDGRRAFSPAACPIPLLQGSRQLHTGDELFLVGWDPAQGNSGSCCSTMGVRQASRLSLTILYWNTTSEGFRIKTTAVGFPGGAVVENLPANAGDTGSSPGLGRSHMPWSNEAREPQLLSLRIWSLCSATREAAIMRGPRTAMESGPHLPQLEKALAQKRRPNTAINK